MVERLRVAVTTKGELKRKAILKVARQCFERYGYAKTSIEDITRSCGITKSSLFYYYESKESLFYHSFTKVWEERLTALVLKAEQNSPIETRIQDYIESSTLYYQTVIKQFGTTVTVLLQNEDQFEQILGAKVHPKVIKFFKNTIEEGMEAGIFAKMDATRLASAIERIECTFRYDALRTAVKQGKSRVNFKMLIAEIQFVIDMMLGGRID